MTQESVGQQPLRKVMLITGASSGIGAELARLAAKHGHDLALVARGKAALDALADEIAASGRPRPLVFACDLGKVEAIDAFVAELAQAGAEPEFLVNNAGYGVLGAAADNDREEQLGIIDLNVRALTDLCLRFVEPLARNKGRILNTASLAGFMPGPEMAVYYASKAYVLSFSQALAHELAPRGVSVTALCPGPVPTGFQARARFSPNLALLKFGALPPQDVAKAGYDGMMAGARTVIPGLMTKITAFSAPFLPNAIALPFIAALQKPRRP